MIEVMYIQDTPGDAQLLREAFKERHFDCEVIMLPRTVDALRFITMHYEREGIAPPHAIIVAVSLMDPTIYPFVQFIACHNRLVDCDIYMFGLSDMKTFPLSQTHLPVDNQNLTLMNQPMDWDEIAAFAERIIRSVRKPKEPEQIKEETGIRLEEYDRV